MEHNQYLNEILYLIEKGYVNKAITTVDLERIQKFTLLISGNKKSSFPHYYDSGEKNEIPPFVASNYRKIFNRYFSGHSKLNKIFEVKSTLLKESIEQKIDTVIKLVEYNGSFEIAYLVNDKIYIIDCVKQQLKPITEHELIDFSNQFKLQCGKDLDANLEILSNNLQKNNTRKITIPYAKNFDNFIPTDEEYIYFIPSIINSPEYDTLHNKFSFIMCFGHKGSNYYSRIDPNSSIVKYFDTFQLCPPTNPPGGTC